MRAGGCRPGLARRRQIFHDDRIGRQLEKGGDVFVAPRAEQQPGGVQRHGHGYFLPRPPVCERNISCSCSNPLRVAGSHVLSIASGSIALTLARNRSCTSLRSVSCNGFTSGSPKKARASSGVQSMSTLNFIATTPSPPVTS